MDDELATILLDITHSKEIPGWSEWLPPHLSAFSLNSMRCLEQWRKIYVLGERQAPSGALAWGKADTAAAAHNYAQKITSHEDCPVGEVKDAFAAALDEAIDKAGGAAEIDWKDSSPADTLDRGVKLAALYHERAAPSVQPVTVEERFEMDVEGVPVPVVGYLDVTAGYLSDLLELPVATRVIERKTGKRLERKLTPEWRVQTMIYQAATELPVDVHLSTKTKVPAVYTPADEPGLAVLRDPAQDLRVEKLVRARASLLLACVETYGPDQPWPDAIGSAQWGDLCSFCGFGYAAAITCAWWK